MYANLEMYKMAHFNFKKIKAKILKYIYKKENERKKRIRTRRRTTTT